MKAYTPSDLVTVLELAGLLIVILLCGFGVARWRRARPARVAAWTLAIAGVAAAERFSANERAGFRMIVIVLALLYAMKAIAAVEACARGERPLSLIAWICFAAGWFGMRPSLFHTIGGPPLPGVKPLIRAGISRLIGGGLLVMASSVVSRSSFSAGQDSWLRPLLTVPLMAGLSLMLHFGVFNVLTGLWRAAGVGAEPLFRAPLASTTLAEFWSRRWNVGFSEMTSLAVYHPASSGH